MPALIQWWTQDLRQLSPTAFEDAVVAHGSAVLHRWTEPHRHYHGTRHLVEVFWALEELEQVEELTADEAVTARVAAWFHDAVYDPRAAAGANEADSADLARQLLPDLDVDPDQVEQIAGLVLLTAGHEGAAPDGASRSFLDADLWILAAEPTRFDAYCQQIRAEYAHVADPAYRSGRAALLENLRDRPALYRTAHAREHWEPQARNNLDRELARLAAPALHLT